MVKKTELDTSLRTASTGLLLLCPAAARATCGHQHSRIHEAQQLKPVLAMGNLPVGVKGIVLVVTVLRINTEEFCPSICVGLLCTAVSIASSSNIDHTSKLCRMDAG